MNETLLNQINQPKNNVHKHVIMFCSVVCISEHCFHLQLVKIICTSRYFSNKVAIVQNSIIPEIVIAA